MRLYFFFVIYFCGIWASSSSHKHLLITLLILEFVVSALYFSSYFCVVFNYSFIFYLLSIFNFIFRISVPKRGIFVKRHTSDTIDITHTYSLHGKQRTSPPVFWLPQVTFSGIF